MAQIRFGPTHSNHPPNLCHRYLGTQPRVQRSLLSGELPRAPWAQGNQKALDAFLEGKEEPLKH